MDEVKQQLLFPQIRSYLKLYTTIGLDKIARFNNLSEEEFSAQLVSMKHKLTQVLYIHTLWIVLLPSVQGRQTR